MSKNSKKWLFFQIFSPEPVLTCQTDPKEEKHRKKWKKLLLGEFWEVMQFTLYWGYSACCLPPYKKTRVWQNRAALDFKSCSPLSLFREAFYIKSWWNYLFFWLWHAFLPLFTSVSSLIFAYFSLLLVRALPRLRLQAVLSQVDFYCKNTWISSNFAAFDNNLPKGQCILIDFIQTNKFKNT